MALDSLIPYGAGGSTSAASPSSSPMVAAVVAGCGDHRPRRLAELRGATRALALALLVTLGLLAVHLVPGALGLLGRGSVLVCAAVWLRRRAAGRPARRRARSRSGTRPRPAAPADTLASPVAASVVAVDARASRRDQLFLAPGSVDILNFHLPGIASWIQDGSIWGVHEFVSRRLAGALSEQRRRRPAGRDPALAQRLPLAPAPVRVLRAQRPRDLRARRRARRFASRRRDRRCAAAGDADRRAAGARQQLPRRDHALRVRDRSRFPASPPAHRGDLATWCSPASRSASRSVPSGTGSPRSRSSSPSGRSARGSSGVPWRGLVRQGGALIGLIALAGGVLDAAQLVQSGNPVYPVEVDGARADDLLGARSTSSARRSGSRSPATSATPTSGPTTSCPSTATRSRWSGRLSLVGLLAVVALLSTRVASAGSTAAR